MSGVCQILESLGLNVCLVTPEDKLWGALHSQVSLSKPEKLVLPVQELTGK